jgi:ABC-2 type transport system ATP-binding protein
MTAQENLRLVCKIKDIGYAKILEKLKLVGLDERKAQDTDNLSMVLLSRNT